MKGYEDERLSFGNTKTDQKRRSEIHRNEKRFRGRTQKNWDKTKIK